MLVSAYGSRFFQEGLSTAGRRRDAPVDATGPVGALGSKRPPLKKGVPVGGESPTASKSRRDRTSDTFLGAIGFDGEKKLLLACNGARSVQAGNV